jgi:hypothetical protein
MNPLFKKLSKGGRKIKELEINNTKSVVKSAVQPASNFQTISNPGTVSSHPLANHPFFKAAIDRLSPNLINLLDIPGKL